MPPRPEVANLLLAGLCLLMGTAIAGLIAASPEASPVSYFVVGLNGFLSGACWQNYWRERDAWRKWKKSRQAEREDTP